MVENRRHVFYNLQFFSYSLPGVWLCLHTRALQKVLESRTKRYIHFGAKHSAFHTEIFKKFMENAHLEEKTIGEFQKLFFFAPKQTNF